MMTQTPICSEISEQRSYEGLLFASDHTSHPLQWLLLQFYLNCAYSDDLNSKKLWRLNKLFSCEVLMSSPRQQRTWLIQKTQIMMLRLRCPSYREGDPQIGLVTLVKAVDPQIGLVTLVQGCWPTNRAGDPHIGLVTHIVMHWWVKKGLKDLIRFAAWSHGLVTRDSKIEVMFQTSLPL